MCVKRNSSPTARRDRVGLREVRGHPASPGAPLPLARTTCSASVPWGWSNYTPSAGGLKQQEFPTVWAVGGPGCRGWRIGPLAGAHLPARGGGLAWGTEGALVVPVPASRPVPCWPRLSLAAPQRPRSWYRQAAGWGPNHPTAGGRGKHSVHQDLLPPASPILAQTTQRVSQDAT